MLSRVYDTPYCLSKQLIRPLLYKSQNPLLFPIPWKPQSLHLADHFADTNVLLLITTFAHMGDCISIDASVMPCYPAQHSAVKGTLSEVQQTRLCAHIMHHPSLPFDRSVPDGLCFRIFFTFARSSLNLFTSAPAFPSSSWYAILSVILVLVSPSHHHQDPPTAS